MRLRLRAGLGLRIWLVTVATVVVALLGMVIALRLAWDPRRHDPGLHYSAYPARQLALRWPDPAALAEEVARIARDARQAATVYRWDGAELASAGRHFPPLSAAEREALRTAGTVPHRCPGDDRPCGTAFALGPAGAPEGYALLGPGMPPPPLRELLPLVLTLLGLGVAAALLGRSIARPLQRLAQAAQALGRGDLSARTGIVRDDELGEVARAFDEMAGRVVGLLRAHTELVANVAHELRTPLARIRVALDLAEEGDPAVARSSLAEITEDLGELERLVDDVLASARMELAAGAPLAGAGVPVMRREPVDVAALLHAAVDKLAVRFPDRSVALRLEEPLPPLVGDALLLRRAVDNLLDNARKYSPRAAPIALRAAAAGGAVRIEVEDEGEGIAAEDLPRLFTPFFRTDRSRARLTGGVGLGLTLSRRIAEAHGGTLVAASVLGRGTTLTLTLPASGAARLEPPSP